MSHIIDDQGKKWVGKLAPKSSVIAKVQAFIGSSIEAFETAEEAQKKFLALIKEETEEKFRVVKQLKVEE